MNQGCWRVSAEPSDKALQGLQELRYRIGELASKLLLGRGIDSPESAALFLNPSYNDLSDPFELPGMDAAVDAVIDSLNRGARIGVAGDFDVDGLTATAILVRSLRSFGGNVSAYIPERASEGHGLSVEAVDSLAADGVSLLLTADTGTTDVEAVEHATRSGIQCVITDHHLPAERLPLAHAIVNPLLGKEVAAPQCGAGVAFKVAQAVGRQLGRAGANDAIALAALGTIADVAPLTGDNRIIVSEGLRMLAATKHPGLVALLERARQKSGPVPPDAELVSYQIAPRLNAPGRLGNPRVSLDLLTCGEEEDATRLASEIEALNSERQRLGRHAWAIALSQLAQLDEIPPLITIVSEEISSGLLGPLAARLCDEHRRPAIAVTVDGNVARGSARSIDGFDIHRALAASSFLLTKFGGHQRAAGFTVPVARLEELLEILGERAREVEIVDRRGEMIIDAEVLPADLDAGLWRFVERMAPFGEANPAPLFLTRGLLPMQVSTVGAAGEHLRLVLDGGAKRQFRAIGFGLGGADLGTGLVDAVYSLRASYWKGRRQRELGLKAVRPAA